ncbi:hypothetical protein [Anaerocolumna sp. MB42-C2]|uniref:hypothetical protein n=1 Tax=Anaerocolumna sp. MB42-C2 TaxID=3070997 RepID=UPI0027E1C2BE|nr:hypothetical protein [Anaerocolumna sp. MB42-C2]WMJ88894.1 hypothetical protein RBU59_05080 [Anaerocolumna sp. MB42-C2]
MKFKMTTYPDGTPITAPFYLTKCKCCGYITWTVQRSNTCTKCGAETVYLSENQNEKKPT